MKINIRKQFIIFFSTYILIIILAVSIISIIFLSNTFDLFINATNKDLIPIMSDKMLEKSIISFIVLTIFVLIISIPIGLLLFRYTTGAYLKIFGKLTKIASTRISEENDLYIEENDKEILENYINILIKDQKKLNEYDKIKSWKDGARLLIHEIKNPLTPLKLSIQSILYNYKDNSNEFYDEISSINSSVNDIEAILKNFKELVNIEFNPIKKLPLEEILNPMSKYIDNLGITISQNITLSSKNAYVKSEIILMKMLITNLINNSIEANPDGLIIKVSEDKTSVYFSFITKNRNIKSIKQIFSFGVSEKGKNRGYGLFLCEKISNYLDLNLKAENINSDVEFSFKITKCL